MMRLRFHSGIVRNPLMLWMVVAEVGLEPTRTVKYGRF